MKTKFDTTSYFPTFVTDSENLVTDTLYTHEITWCDSVYEWMNRVKEGGSKYQEVMLHSVGLTDPRIVLDDMLHSVIEKIELVDEDIKHHKCVDIMEFVEDNTSWDSQYPEYEINVPNEYQGKTCRIEGSSLVFDYTERVFELRFMGDKGYTLFSINDFENMKFGFTTGLDGSVRSLVIAIFDDDVMVSFREFMSEKNHYTEWDNSIVKSVRNFQDQKGLSVQQFCRKVVRFINNDGVVYKSMGKKGIVMSFPMTMATDYAVKFLGRALGLYGYSVSSDTTSGGIRTINFQQ